jgi:hypothetical protein
MNTHTALAVAGIVLFLTFAGALTYFYTAIGCSPVPTVAVTNGSQGFRTWSGPSLVTFEHGNKKICIESGWESLGAQESGSGWARFEEDLTGVVVRSADFEEKKLTPVFSAYEVRLLFPKNTPAPEQELYEATVVNAFERVGKLFNDSAKNEKRIHTVLVTAGVPRTDDKMTPIYPDPRRNLSIYVQSPTSARGEELLIHAVTHLYNRQRKDLSEYQKNQTPLPPEDFQELEASWAELIYRTSSKGREARIQYLYTIHAAVQSKNFSLVQSYPFNSSKEEFDAIRPSVSVNAETSFLNAQYAHYILAPLTMLGIEGLLQKKGASLEALLTEIHQTDENFFETLAKTLSVEEVQTIRSWMFEGRTIPYELVRLGSDSYNSR